MAAPQGWSKLYDNLPEHPKILAAGPQAGWLYICGQAYCSRHLTDGRIPKDAVPLFTTLKRWRKDVVALLEAGLWHEEKDHYLQHDYCEMQRTASEVESYRSAGKERQRRHRMSRRDKRVTNGDVTEQEKSKSKSTKLRTSEPGGSDTPKRKEYEPSTNAEECVAAWEKHKPLAKPENRQRYCKVFDDLHRIDKLSWDDIHSICRHACEKWMPKGFIQSLISLREPSTKIPDMKTWQVIQGQIASYGSDTDDGLDDLMSKIGSHD